MTPGDRAQRLIDVLGHAAGVAADVATADHPFFGGFPHAIADQVPAHMSAQ